MINEAFQNLLPGNLYQKYIKADEVWDMLQKSYSAIGGIKGSGFNSKDDMVKNIPFWKLAYSGGDLKVVVMYKDKQGRKLVALGAKQGDPEAKPILFKILTEELKRSWAEYSGALLSSVLKHLDLKDISKYAINPNIVKILLKGDDIETNFEPSSLNSHDQILYSKFPQLKPFFYLREIGGGKHLKMALGKHGLSIKT